ncbi:MAG: PqqD family peptide modification chaperone [Sedimenticola sp.]
MQPAEGTHLLFLDNQGVLFHEPSQKLFHLNTTAAFIWCLVEEGMAHGEILSRLQQTFSLSADDADSYYRQTKELLQSLGAIKGFEKEPEDEEVPPEQPEPLLNSDDIFTEERRYSLLSSHIRMRFSDAEFVALVDPVLAHLQDDDSTPENATIDIFRDDTGAIQILRDNIPIRACDEEIMLVPLVKGLVWITAVNAHDFFLDIHAGVIGDGTHCFLFPAAPGSGKSTLTTALAHNGFEYFSDEVALLHGDELEVCPVPLATCVKDTGTDILSHYYPGLAELALHLRNDGKRVRYMPPPMRCVPPADTLRPVGAIVFPRYNPDEKTELSTLGHMEALQSLMQECLIVDTHLDLAKVSTLLHWIERTPCYRLSVASLDDAVNLVRNLSEELKAG